jgi:hypothetical protein
MAGAAHLPGAQIESALGDGYSQTSTKHTGFAVGCSTRTPATHQHYNTAGVSISNTVTDKMPNSYRTSAAVRDILGSWAVRFQSIQQRAFYLCMRPASSFRPPFTQNSIFNLKFAAGLTPAVVLAQGVAASVRGCRQHACRCSTKDCRVLQCYTPHASHQVCPASRGYAFFTCRCCLAHLACRLAPHLCVSRGLLGPAAQVEGFVTQAVRSYAGKLADTI